MRTPALLLVAGLAAASAVACSGDDDAAAPPTTPDVTTVVTSAPASSAPATTETPTSLVTPATSPVTTTTVDDATTTAPIETGAYPAQPEGVPFPATDWPTAALPAGVDQAVIDAAVDVAFGAPDAQARVRSVVVVQGGAIVYERYHPLDGPDEVMSSYSVAKSFTSAIVGQLVADGKLALDEHPPRPEWPAGDPRAAITLRELLQMSSGLEWDEVQSLVTLGLTMLTSPSAAAIMAQQPLEREPGTEFEYSTGTSALVAGIAADALGGCPALDTYLHERLLDPLGITTATITEDGGGCFVGGFGMDMTTRDFARFGLLYARGGQWDGEQILPTAWIEQTREPAPTNPQYGLHWWRGPASFSAEGLFGQRIVVVPGADLVLAINSTQGGDPFTLGNAILAAFGTSP